MINIEGQEYLSREEFFAQKWDGFKVEPLDVNLAKAQYELLKQLRSGVPIGENGIETVFEMNSPQLALSTVCLKCFLVAGLDDIYDIVIRVEDRNHENFAYGWIKMGTLKDIERKLDGNGFVPTCKLWAKWLDYSRNNYPISDGELYYWTEWQSVGAEKHWYNGDPDLYGICSYQCKELFSKLGLFNSNNQPNKSLTHKNMMISCDYPGAPGRETKFDAMELRLFCYVTGRIDLVGIIWFDVNFESIPTRVIVHSFDSVEQCLRWLGRDHCTANDCCQMMGGLLKCGRNYICKKRK